jgi:PKD repeat protein
VVGPHSERAEALLVMQVDGREVLAQRYAALSADFSANPVADTLPLAVTFTNQSAPTTTITSYLWNFGDGYTSTITNPTHSYTPTGVFAVALTAYAGAEQETVTKTNYLTVTSEASPISTTVIHYTYDPLSRLTGATYSGAYNTPLRMRMIKPIG